MDSQSVKNTDSAEQKGYDAGKKVSGIKRHIAVDTQGLPHAIHVTTANVTDRAGALAMFDQRRDGLSLVQNVLVDGGYTGDPFAAGVQSLLGASVEVVKRNEMHTFVVLPKRWVVERSFAWLEKCRRLWKNCERKLNTSLQMVVLAFAALILKRLQTGSNTKLENDGFRLTGRWEFSSGCDAATWVIVGVPGFEERTWVLVPREDYQILDTWFVSGLSSNPPMDTDGQREDNGRGVREYRRDNPGSNLGRREVGGRSAGAFGGADGGLQWLWRARWRDRTRQEALADWASASLRGRWVGWRVSGGRAPSGWEWNGSQSGQGAAELLLPGPALGKMQGDPACRAGEPSGQGEDPPPEGLGGHDLLTQADAGCPASQVVGHHLYRQPGAVGGKAARGEMVQPDAVLEVAYRILDLGVAAVVSLQFQGLPVPVGDEAVIAVGGEESQLRTGRRLHPLPE